MADFEGPSVAAVSADLAGVLRRFRGGDTFAFSFGDGRPEAVVLTHDEFVELGGEGRVRRRAGVVALDELSAGFSVLVGEIRSGTFVPLVWGDGEEPLLMIMSAAQYRELRGDHGDASSDDDPAKRIYASEPLPESKPFDPWAAEDEYTRRILDEIRNEKGLPRDET